MKKSTLSNAEVMTRAREVARRIGPGKTIYGVPRGGIPAAYAVATGAHGALRVVDNESDADVVVDDVIDSGATMNGYQGKPFYALVDKTGADQDIGWVVFPWEGDAVGSIEGTVTRLLQYVGEDPSRGGLADTPGRVAEAWRFWCSGYDLEPGEILKVFDDGAENYNQMVVVKDIPIYSHCEHHMAPVFGTATIAYIPDGRIVGLSKLSRLADMYARRLQVQERLTNNIADALDDHLAPIGVGVVIKARHMCMESRGVCQQGHHTITSALRGALLDSADTRSEFMELAR